VEVIREWAGEGAASTVSARSAVNFTPAAVNFTPAAVNFTPEAMKFTPEAVTIGKRKLPSWGSCKLDKQVLNVP
jgi:hypothetical protein